MVVVIGRQGASKGYLTPSLAAPREREKQPMVCP
jgi:hypothetical protein